jgi:hypothetical protein
LKTKNPKNFKFFMNFDVDKGEQQGVPPKTSSTIFVEAQRVYKTSNFYETLEKRISPIG